MFFFKQCAALLGTALTLSSLPLPRVGAQPVEEPRSAGPLDFQSLVLPSLYPKPKETATVEVSKEQLKTEVANSNVTRGGVMLDTGGAAWTGHDARLTDSISMRVLVPDTAKAPGFNQFGYIGVTTRIRGGAGHRIRLWNSDLGIAIDAKKEGALPFVTCGDRTLDMARAKVTVVEYREGQAPRVLKGAFDHTGRYYSFKMTSPLREAVTFKSGDLATVKVARNKSTAGDGLIMTIETSEKSVKIDIPVRSSFLSAARSISAHKVVSAVHMQGFAPRKCLATASNLVLREDVKSYPALQRIREAAEVEKFAGQDMPSFLSDPIATAGNPALQAPSATTFAPEIYCTASADFLDFSFPSSLRRFQCRLFWGDGGSR